MTDILREYEGTGITEPERIVVCGGVVTPNSPGVPVVNGRLGMTCSLSDAELKVYGVSARPHLTCLKVINTYIRFSINFCFLMTVYNNGCYKRIDFSKTTYHRWIQHCETWKYRALVSSRIV